METYIFDKYNKSSLQYSYQSIFVTESLNPVGKIYDYLVSFKSICLINSISIIWIMKKKGIINHGNNLNKIITNNIKNIAHPKNILTFFIVTTLNYSIFYRSFKKEFPFVDYELDLKSKMRFFDKLMNSLIRVEYIYIKDSIIISIILLLCLPFIKSSSVSTDLTNLNDINSVTNSLNQKVDNTLEINNYSINNNNDYKPTKSSEVKNETFNQPSTKITSKGKFL